MAVKLSYRAVFLSDLHLGSSGCRAAELAAFLKRIECDRLYLVGDVIDMWRLKQRWYWPEKHNRVIGRILKLAKNGTKVIFVPGNHDEHARQYIGMHFGGVEVARESVHVTADGRRLLITHGDQFDMVVKHAPMISRLGAWGYDTLVSVNVTYNWLRKRLGLRYWSLSQYVKLKVKKACTFIAQFEETLLDEARRRGFDGVVCGHIHKAEIRRNVTSGHGHAGEQKAGVDYFNCGDWVESCTALVELDDGSIRLVDGIGLVEQLKEQRLQFRGSGQMPSATEIAESARVQAYEQPASQVSTK